MRQAGARNFITHQYLKKKAQAKATEAGFSLIEMAIVLVIIGLLLGGVLKGQALIESSRVKSLLNDIHALSAAFYGYDDRYRQLAGDDGNLAALQARGGQWANISLEGDRNGIWDITAANTFAGTGEGGAFFQHLRAAGFIHGNPADTGTGALPRHAFGGWIGVTANAVTGMPANGRYLCVGSVPGSAARAIDLAKDDGVANLGVVRATQGINNAVPAATATSYTETDFYTLCLAL